MHSAIQPVSSEREEALRKASTGSARTGFWRYKQATSKPQTTFKTTEQHGAAVPGPVLLTLNPGRWRKPMSNTPANGPSKTGNPSGGGRGNNPPRK